MKTITELEDVKTIGNVGSGITLIHGDCLDVMPLLPDVCFDAIIADIPYG
jgi:hypothetical protein